MLKIQPQAISRCHTYLDNMGNINQQSVQNLPKEVKEFLRQMTPKRLKELAQMNCFAANRIKATMDNTYGENNYIIIAIGRSLSSITETLGRMGVKVKILPLSRLKRFSINVPLGDEFSWDGRQIHGYKRFLAHRLNLKESDLEQNKDKEYIIMDYAYTGWSIKKAEELFKRADFFGNAPNLSSKKINDVLEEDFYDRGFRTLFHYHRFKNYSYVGEFNIGIEDVIKAYDQSCPATAEEYQGNITQGLRKLFWFNVFDSIVERNYKDITPKNELKAIYKHYLSPKVVQKSIRQKEKEAQAWIKILKRDNEPEDEIAKHQHYYEVEIQHYIKRMEEEKQLLMKALYGDKK